MLVSKKRIVKLVRFFVLAGCLILLRLFYLQVMISSDLAEFGLSSRIKEVTEEIDRGEIVDRFGNSFTGAVNGFHIFIFPKQIYDVKQTAVNLAPYVGSSADSLRIWLETKKAVVEWPVVIDISNGENLKKINLPGIAVVPARERYNRTGIAAHVLGYVNSIDNHGLSGIEYTHDFSLRGTRTQYVAQFVDASDQIIPGLGYKRVWLGKNRKPYQVKLTLDSSIQRKVEAVLDKYSYKAAVVVMDPASGEILAMVSRPNFDPNHIEKYLTQMGAPLINRALAAYQPGSVFKLVVAAAALEQKLVTPQDVFFDPGYIEIGGIKFQGWDHESGGRGKITFSEAIAYSSNPVLIEVGQRLKKESVVEYAKKFGFGETTGLSLPEEASGNLPNPEQIFAADLANLSIGQGTLEATPVQVVSLIATIANGGIRFNPQLIRQVADEQGNTIQKLSPRSTRVISSQTARQLQQMMIEVTSYGTGQAAFVSNGGSAGKTGSAETGRRNAKGESINHAWFAGYAPIMNPKYAMVVFVEDGMSGGEIAAPLFQEIMDEVIKQ